MYHIFSPTLMPFSIKQSIPGFFRLIYMHHNQEETAKLKTRDVNEFFWIR